MTSAQKERHWTQQFPDLASVDPMLDVLRHVLLEAPADHPIARLRDELEQGLGQALDLGTPGDPDKSFNARWVLAVLEALRAPDLHRYQFLLRSRLKPGDAARVHFALTQACVWLDARC